MTAGFRRRTPIGASFDSDLPEPLLRVYRNRGLRSASELDLSLSRLLPPNDLHGVQAAAALLGGAIRDGTPILVVADYDADGATACALLIAFLRALGATEADFLVPNRFDHGYGLTEDVARLAIAKRPGLLITVDNGISSLAGVELCKSAGITVIVTDHHLPPATLPRADCIVNPNLEECQFPSKALAGVGVAFYLAAATRAWLQAQGLFQRGRLSRPRMADLLDLVALGTVADLVPLDFNNRVLVQQGLERIRSGRARPGIAALLVVAAREAERVSAADLGFALAPRLNAAGRLTDMALGIECLLTENVDRARELALRLDTLNRERRTIESEMGEQATRWLTEALAGLNEPPPGLVLHDPRWHPGVVGILAARIKDRYHRPSIVFADDQAGFIRGSGRSVPGVNLRDLLADLASTHPGLIERFGGHAMAAGLTLARHRLERFRELFTQRVADRVAPELLDRQVWTDGPLDPADLSLEFGRLLAAHGPWGQGFPEPVFDGRFRIVGQRLLAGRHLRLELQPEDGQRTLVCVWFGCDRLQDETRIELAYRVTVNEYRSRQSLQLVVEAVRPA